MASTDAQDLLETSSNQSKTASALLVSVLAMILALASVGGSNSTKEATMNNILAANDYAFYQAKNIRQTAYKIAADNLQILLADEKLNAASRTLIDAKLKAYQKNIDRYESEPDTKEGKKELMLQAKQHELERDIALRRDPWFDYAGALLQIAIVLTSVALITGVRFLLVASVSLGFIGTLCTVNGFFLLY
jgi:Skp family chaperone for outer membrane proteins